MAIKWNHFAGAVLLTWLVLLWMGAPPIPLAIGTAFVAVWNWRKRAAAR